jgi:hypothetical protein
MWSELEEAMQRKVYPPAYSEFYPNHPRLRRFSRQKTAHAADISALPNKMRATLFC